MAGRIAYLGNIVTQGLVLNLDAGIKGSYPGTGNTWSDISNNGNNGTLINGPTFSSDDYGSIVFDGVNDYVDLGTLNLVQNDFTVNLWFKTTSTVSKESYLFSLGYNLQNSLLIYNNSLGNGTANLTIIYSVLGSGIFSHPLNTNVYPDTSLINLCITRENGINTPYINGVKQTSRIFTQSVTLGSLRYILGWALPRNKSTAYMQGNLYSCTLYNKALSQSEITQNFNAYRSRYGI